MKISKVHSPKKLYSIAFIVVFVFVVAASLAPATEKRPLTFTDMMKFKAIRDVQISDNGEVLAYTLKPDRGNPEVLVKKIDEQAKLEITGGEKPIVTADGLWVAASRPADFLALEKDKKKKLKPGMVLLDAKTGAQTEFERIKSFQFSKNSRWLIYQHHPEEKKKEEDDKKESDDKDKKEDKSKSKKEREIHRFVLRRLPDGKEFSLDSTGSFALDPEGRFVAVEIITPGESSEASLLIYRLDKGSKAEKTILQTRSAFELSKLSWSKKKSRLAFLWSEESNDKTQKIPAYELWVWDGLKGRLAEVTAKGRVPAGWMIPPESALQWGDIVSEDLLYVGLKPVDDYLFYKGKAASSESGDDEEGDDGFNLEKILADRGVDVWHWQDPIIKPQEKIEWKKNKKKTFRAVFHVPRQTLVPLADKAITDIQPSLNTRVALASTREPYLVESTWTQRFKDYYLVSLKNGQRKKLLTRHQGKALLSPLGKYFLYFSKGDWTLMTVADGKARNLTEALDAPFANEDHDYPSPAPSYGIAGWVEDDRGVLVYDKFDIWYFHTGSAKVECLTGGSGRKNRIGYRVVKTDPEQKFFTAAETLLLRGQSHSRKTTHFYKLSLANQKLEQLVAGPKKYRFVKKAKEANVYLYTRESFTEFPDIRVTDETFGDSKKLTGANPQMKDFLWGSAELVEWNSADGIPLQGVVMKPDNFDPKKRYPVLVYYYRLISHRLYDFNRPVVNHRPCFPFYTGHDYVVFLPDIRFKIGSPGFSATKCLVPGVQKLIDLGIADPDAVALHGHSWSGYQTAFVITQTDLFAAAIAGAPVSNMTSAYSGIRWGSGLARQFQYEVSQSRIGGSLWEYPEKYIENSPVFFAHRINTPLLMMHGDVDDAVPWYQSIEMYLAMRRLQKDCIFLQYNDEPHHPKKYPNKLDYAMKMKEYLDYYLKKRTPVPEWIDKGSKYIKR